MTHRITGMHQNILQIKLCMDLSTQAVPVPGSIFKILPARGTRPQKTENITAE